LPLRVIVRPLLEKSIAREYSRPDGITRDAAPEEINVIRRAAAAVAADVSRRLTTRDNYFNI